METKNNNSKGCAIAAIVGGVIILVGLPIIAIGGYFAWKHWVKSKVPSTTYDAASISSSLPATNTAPESTNKNAQTSEDIKDTQAPRKSALTQPDPELDSGSVGYDSGDSVRVMDSSYIISDSDRRFVAEAELWDLSDWELKVARNEIYARHGRAFVHKDLQCYFAKKSWYVINPNFSNSLLSDVENVNIATILNWEEKINSSYLRYDSGCGSH